MLCQEKFSLTRGDYLATQCTWNKFVYFTKMLLMPHKTVVKFQSLMLFVLRNFQLSKRTRKNLVKASSKHWILEFPSTLLRWLSSKYNLHTWMKLYFNGCNDLKNRNFTHFCNLKRHFIVQGLRFDGVYTLSYW